MKTTLAAILALAAATTLYGAATVYSGADAVKKIKASIPGADLDAWGISSTNAKWCEIMPGVEYSFAQYTKLFGVKDDVSLLRIDYKKAKLKMKLVVNNSLTRTSTVTKNNGALFGVSGTFYSSSTGKLSYRTKVGGTVVNPDVSGGGGLLFNDNDPYKLFRFTRGFGTPRILEHWDNALPSDCVLIDGKCSLEGTSWTSGNPTAGFPVLGVNEKTGIIYLFVIDGRRSVSKGITYLDSCTLLQACGCDGGYVLDGGGSTTLAMKSSLLPSKLSAVQWDPSYASGYTIMNYTNSDGSTKTERYVKSQLLFMAGDEAAAVPDGAYYDFLRTDGAGGSEGQRVQLDYRPSSETVASALFSLVNAPSADVNQCLWGARTSGTSTSLDDFSYFLSVGKNQRFDYGPVRSDTKSALGRDTLYQLTIAGNVMSNVTYDTQKLQKAFTAPAASFTAGGDMSLFMSYNQPGSGWSNAAAVDFYSMQLADRVCGREMLVSDLAGSYRNGKYGLYDAVQDRFYPSEGTRDFEALRWALIRPGSSIVVSGNPICFPCDALGVKYGVTHWHKSGETIAVKKPSAQQTVGDGMRATCTGWKLTQGGTTTTKTANFTYTHGNTDARLVAQWDVECRLDVAPLDATKGTVTAASGWKAYDAAVTLTATPKTGERFWGWTGDIGTADPKSPTITVTMNRARTIRADFGPRFLDSVVFPKGAYVTTSVIPSDHETTATFSCDYLNNGWVFGTSKGANYYALSMAGSYWRWGLNGSNRTGKSVGTNVALCDGNVHTVVYRERGTGNVVIDGEVLESVAASTSTAALLIGNGSTAATGANFTGRLYAFTVRDASGEAVLDLKPCVRFLADGSSEVALYDAVSGAYLKSAVQDKPLEAGLPLNERLVVGNAVLDGLAMGAKRTLSVPAEETYGAWAKSTCTGWRRYRLDPVTGAWTETDSGTGSTLDYVHDGFATKVEWERQMTQLAAGDYVYVSPDGDDANKGTSWDDAYATVQAAVDAAEEGATVLVAPGHYFGTERSFNAKADYLTCIRLAKRVNVIGVGGRERTLMDGGFVYPRNGAYVTADGALLAGFTFTNTAHTTTGRNLGVDLTAGTVSDVSFHARAAANSTFLNINATVGHVLATDILLPPQPVLAGNVQGGIYVNAIGAKGATIDGLAMCNWLLGGLSANYSMINLKGSAATAPIVLRNALVADNQMGIDLNANRGNIVYADAHSRVINCTIVNNEVRGPNSGIRVAANTALVENCIIRGNRSAMNAYGDIYNNANVGYVYTTLCDQLDVVTKDNPNHNLNGNPNFADEANGDYRLAGLSKCVDAGGEKNGDASLFGEFDLAGSARVVGAAVDLGCYEHQATDELEIGFEASAEESAPGHQLAVTFTGKATGTGDVAAVWDFGDGTTATGWPVVDHSYAAPGLYAVTLTVTRGGQTVSYTLADVARVLPSVCYVKADGGKGVWPYDTMDKATDDLAAALEVGSPRVLVGPGTYTLPLPCVAIGRAVELKSMEGPEKTILDSSKAITDRVHRHFTVYNDKAVVSGFTLTGGYSSSAIQANYAAALDIGAGTVENCIIRDTGRLSAGQIVNLWGSGKLVGCELDGRGLDVHDYSYTGTAAIYLTGASCVVDGCWIHGYQIRGNCDNKTTFTCQAPVVVNHASAVMRNSLITCCTNALTETTANTNHSGIVQIFKGKVENCTIADNFIGGFGAVNFALANNKEATVTAGSLVNCILSGNVSLGGEPGVWCPKTGATWSNCYVGDAPGYATGADAVPYSLAAGSPCIDAGEDLAWVATGWDLAGNPRLAGEHVDLGCLESGSSVTRYTIKEVSADGKSTNTVTVLEDELVKTVEGAAYGAKMQLLEKLEKDTDIMLAPGVEIAFAEGQDLTKIHLKVPSDYYRAPIASGGIVRALQLDPTKVTPAFADGDGPALTLSGDGRISFNVSNVKGGLRYELKSAASPSGPWTTELFKFSASNEDVPFSAEAADPVRFYKVEVTDKP